MAVLRYSLIGTLFFSFFLLMGGCVLPECENFECPDGQACIVENDQPVCVDTGGGGGGSDGGNGIGESCDSDADCEGNLVCEPDLAGLDVCTEPI